MQSGKIYKTVILLCNICVIICTTFKKVQYRSFTTLKYIILNVNNSILDTHPPLYEYLIHFDVIVSNLLSKAMEYYSGFSISSTNLKVIIQNLQTHIWIPCPYSHILKQYGHIAISLNTVVYKRIAISLNLNCLYSPFQIYMKQFFIQFALQLSESYFVSPFPY